MQIHIHKTSHQHYFVHAPTIICRGNNFLCLNCANVNSQQVPHIHKMMMMMMFAFRTIMHEISREKKE